jgi:hypothetical protein
MCKIVKDAVIPMMVSQVSEGKEKRDVIPGKDNVAGGVEWSVSISSKLEYVAKVRPRFKISYSNQEAKRFNANLYQAQQRDQLFPMSRFLCTFHRRL